MADAPQDWRIGLPEDIRGHESLKDFKDPGALAKSYIETKAMVGQSLRLPGPDAGAEDKAAFITKLRERFPDSVYMPTTSEEAAKLEKQLWEKLGRPADAKGYSLEGVDLGGQEVNVEQLAKMAAELGMTKSQFQSFARGLAKSQGEQASAMKAQQDALRKEWGAAHAEKLAGAAATAQKLGAPKSVVEAINAGRISVEEAKFYDAISGAMNGSAPQVRDQGAGAGVLTPAEAKERINEIMRNPQYFRGGPEHDALVRRHGELMRLAYPDLVGKAT